MRLILASKSPRRAELLRAARIDFQVRATELDESVIAGESPVDYVRRVARAKALAAAPRPGEMVLGADTTVVAAAGEILGKPANPEDVKRMIRLLSRAQHQVITGICLASSERSIEAHETTLVWMDEVNQDELDEYSQSTEPMDKAGAYAIQGVASRWITRIEGSYSNVVGLPVALVCRLLARFRD